MTCTLLLYHFVHTLYDFVILFTLIITLVQLTGTSMSNDFYTLTESFCLIDRHARWVLRPTSWSPVRRSVSACGWSSPSCHWPTSRLSRSSITVAGRSVRGHSYHTISCLRTSISFLGEILGEFVNVCRNVHGYLLQISESVMFLLTSSVNLFLYFKYLRTAMDVQDVNNWYEIVIIPLIHEPFVLVIRVFWCV